MNMQKTIYIEADEEITSVVSIIKKTKEPKIALVIPKGSIILGSIVNLKMLKKHEKNLSKDITVVTTDSNGRHLASEVGFEVMHSLDDKKVNKEEAEPKAVAVGPKIEFKEDAESLGASKENDTPEITFKKIKDVGDDLSDAKEKPKKAAPSKKKKKGLSKLVKRLLFGFGFFSFAAGVLVFLFVLPKATISISPKAEELRQDVSLEIKNEGELGGELVEIVQEASKAYVATGKKNIGEKAKGTVTVYNEWDSNAQPLVSGTRFVSGGKIFKTTQAVSVPGTTVQAGNIVAGTANVNVEAQEPGEVYNIGASTFTIPGLPADKQAKIYGKSSQAMSGGFTKEVKVVSEKDIEDGKANLGGELTAQAKEELSKEAQGKKVLEAAINEETIEEKLSANEGQEAEELTLTIKKSFWTVSFDEEKVKEKIVTEIKETIPENQEIVEGRLENIEYKVVDITKENGLSLSASAIAFTTEKLELEKAKLDLPGKDKEEVTQYFKQKEEIMDVDIKFWPSWVNKVPVNRSRIEIKINIQGNK